MKADAADGARRKEWQLYKLNADMMTALEESGGEFTPEVEAIEARIAESAHDLAEMGVNLSAHAEAQIETIKKESQRLAARTRYMRRLEGLAKRWLRIAEAELGSRFDVGTFSVSLSKPAPVLKGGPATRSDGWHEVGGNAQSSWVADLVSRGLARHGIRFDRTAVLAAVKKGDEVLDFRAERPAERTVTIK